MIVFTIRTIRQNVRHNQRLDKTFFFSSVDAISYLRVVTFYSMDHMNDKNIGGLE